MGGVRRVGFVSLIVVMLSAGNASIGQQQQGGLTAGITVNQRVLWRDNPNLDTSTDDAGFVARTSLSLRMSSVTRRQFLRFSLQGQLQNSTAEGFEVIGPTYRLAYGLNSKNARLRFNSRYRNIEIDGFSEAPAFDAEADPLDSVTEEPTEDDGTDETPETPVSADPDPDPLDPDEATDTEDDGQDLVFDTGRREDLRTALVLEHGLRGPLLTRLSVNRATRIFTDIDDPDLFDAETLNVAALVRAQVDPRVTLAFSARRTIFEADNAEQTHRETTRYRLSGSFDIDRLWRMTASLSSNSVITERNSGTSKQEGYGFQLGLNRQMQNGTLRLTYGSRVNADGRTNTLRLQRAQPLPNGDRLSYNIGISKPDALDPSFVFGFTYNLRRPNGANLALSANQRLSVNSDDNTVRRTTLGLQYGVAINSRDRLTTGLDYQRLAQLANDTVRERADLRVGLSRSLSAQARLTGSVQMTRIWNSADQSRLSVSAGYRRDLTRDWDFTSSATVQRAKDGNGPWRTNRTVSFGIERSFSYRP